MVIENDRGNRGEQARRGGHERFGDTGRDGTKAGGTGAAEAGEGVNDAPDGPKKSDERRHGGGDGEPRHVALKARDFFRGSNLHAPLHRRQAAKRGGRRGELTFVFLEPALEYADQRAGAKLIRDRGNILQALRFAKGAQEAPALQAGAGEQAPFGKNDGPGNQTERQQGEQDELGDRAGRGNEIENFAANKQCQQEGKMHRV